MSDSPELLTVRNCTPELEVALKALDRDLIHYLHIEGFFTDNAKELNPVPFLTDAEIAQQLVPRITNRVSLDPQSYHDLVKWFKGRSGNQ